MTIKQVLSENPKITSELSEFFKQKLLNSAENNKKVPHSFKKLLSNTGVSEEMILSYLQATPRLICDFMDEKEIIILPTHNTTGFSFTINGASDNKTYMNRIDAELSAVISSINYYSEKK